MTEKLSPEVSHQPATPEKPLTEKAPEHHKSIEKSAELPHDHTIDKLKESIHKEAVSSRETSVGEHRQDTQPMFGMQRELKADAYEKTLQKVRSRLNPTERTLSKAFHQPFVEKASDIGSKTFARPSAILGGGIVAFVGSSIVLYISKHYGFSYNFSVFLMLFGGGFIAGLLAELAIRTIIRKK